ncbi:Os09g0409350, partial [Oryza sativa Japonica Group]
EFIISPGSSTRREHFSTDTDSPDAYARCRLKTRTNRRGFSYRVLSINTCLEQTCRNT